MLFVLRFVSGLCCHAILNTLKVNELFFKDSLQAVTNPLLSLSLALSLIQGQASLIRAAMSGPLCSQLSTGPLPLNLIPFLY